jgi:hypothetical protein
VGCGCMGVWVCGCVGVWVCGCVGVWVCGCEGAAAGRMRYCGVMNARELCWSAAWTRTEAKHS